VDELESRILLSRTFLDTENNDTFATRQTVNHVAGIGIVDSATPSSGSVASITDNDPDFFGFSPAVDGRVVVNVTHLGGDPSGDGTAATDDNLRVALLNSAGTVIAGPFNLDAAGATQEITQNGVLATDVFAVRVMGEDAGDDANYQVRIRTIDRFDDAVANNRANNRRSDATAGSQSNLGTVGAGGTTATDFTIVGTDKDFYRFTSGPTVQTLNITVTMPAGTGPRSGSSGPTNLGVHVRNANGAVIAASNGTGTTEVATIVNAPSNTLFFIDVYGSGPSQVNRYDVQIAAPTPSGVIRGQKFNDLNGDGIHDENEPGLNGWTIFLDIDNSGTLNAGDVSATTTDVDLDGDASIDLIEERGIYTFSGLADGTYRVLEVVQSGWIQTFPANEDPDQPFRHEVIITDSDNVDGLDFGNFETFTISGRKYNDLDGDGTDDGGADPGLGGVTIFLDIDNSGDVSAGDITATTTAGTGAYSFSGLGPQPSGFYTVCEQVPIGATQTAPPTGCYTVPAVSGQDVTDIDFGNFFNATISGRKFDDTNGDGSGTGDLGQGGVTIQLVRDTNSNGMNDDPVIDTAVTATGTGAYSFTVTAGTYFVQEVVPSNSTQTAPPSGFYTIIATSGGTFANNDFGNFAWATISGRKFNDVNGDGNGTGDPGQGGVTIQLVRDANGDGMNNDAVIATATSTAGSGAYSFTITQGGTYFVQEVVPGSSTQTTPATFYTVTVSSGGTFGSNDFGNFAWATFSGRKYNDTNGDGDGTGDSGQGGVTIQLIRDANSNGMNDDAVIDMASSTAGTGAYSFTITQGGTYFVQEVVPASSTQTQPVSPTFYTFVATSGATSTNNDFGNFAWATISGRKFDDTDGDGTGDGGTDPAQSGVTIQLIRDANNNNVNDDAVIATATSAVSTGAYSFTIQQGGRYFVQEVVPSNSTPTVPLGPAYYTVVATSGGTFGNRDFGNFVNFSISGRKFDDQNNNGMDDGEPGIGGVTICLDNNNSGDCDIGDPTTTTASITGDYIFTNVGPRPSGYVVREVPPAGSTQTFPAGGAGHNVTATSGVNVTGRDFGNFTFVGGVVAGTKYTDFRADGITPPGSDDTPLGGFTIQAWRDDGDGIFEPCTGAGCDTLVATAVTATGTGAYRISGLNDGLHFIRELLNSGYVQTSPPNPTNSDNFYPVVVDLGAGANSFPGRDFGNTNCRDFEFDDNNQANYTVTATRVGAITFEVINPAIGTKVVVQDTSGNAITVFTFDGSGNFVPQMDGMLRTSQMPDPETRLRADVVTAAGTTYRLNVMGSGLLRVTNQVNIDVGATLALQIAGDRCDDLIAVKNAERLSPVPAVDVAKRVFVGTVTGRPPTPAAVGTQYDDIVLDALFGTPTISRVEINSGAGHDVVRIREQVLLQSTISGGSGDDTIRAGDGKSTINAQAGFDRVLGGLADDVLNGGADSDQLFGLDGADRADGGDGADLIGGGNGDDPLLRGGNGNDTVSGGPGRDRLIGDAGTDTIYRDTNPADTQVSGEVLLNEPAPTGPLDALLAEWNADGGAVSTWDELITALLPLP
jgi:hypothetical protein